MADGPGKRVGQEIGSGIDELDLMEFSAEGGWLVRDPSPSREER
jgi:hypothetical protein